MNTVAQALSIINELEPSTSEHPGGGLENIRSVSRVETRYGLVAILVTEEVWDAQSSGFFSAFWGTNHLSERIETYASDVQAALPWTKSIIIEVSPEDTPVEIRRLLERLYFEGNPSDSDKTQLNGIVLVGDVPLPVVNKNGNRFISLLPYTDFEEPSYLLDENTQDFLRNEEAQNLQTEVWHGVIVPPLNGQEGYDLLAAYFDKNHQFHTGDEDYTTFNQKTFIADFVTEEATINPTAYASYQRFLNLWEELTYYRYTNDLVEELYTDMQSSVQEGDSLDNDGDGAYDEEALNGIDDDGDGWVDEDNGDGFYGIDNDQDGAIDEDSFEDNNNDAGWLIDLYLEGDADIFEDRMVDEDPPGDTTGGEDANGDGYADGDGCPGLCEVDDNGDAVDHDNDGYPTGWEIVFGYDWADERKPWGSVKNKVNSLYGTSYTTADEATAYLEAMFVDQFYNSNYKHPSCYEGSTYHPEWDDDEDGFCDEDGSTEMQLWADDDGTPASGSCAYNDGDCDGEIDEDPLGIQPEGLFDDLPDIQAKKVVESLISRYVELFEQPQGVWNRLVDQTGRYSTRAENEDGTVRNDYDTAISLISKKDEYTLKYLTRVNTAFEDLLDGIVKENLARDIPIIAGLQIRGEYTAYTENEDGEIEEDRPEDFCNASANANLEGDACLQFINHSAFNQGLFDDETAVKDLDQLNAGDFFISGENLWDVDSPALCTTFAGTDEEGGQLVQFNSIYSREFGVSHQDMNKQEVQDYRNCVPEYFPYLDDIGEVCDEATAVESIRTLDGAIAKNDGGEEVDTSRWEVGAEACFEFREMETFNDYTQTMVEFNNWLTGKIRHFRKDDESDEEANYEEFLEKVEEKREDIESRRGRRPDEATLRKHFSELDIFAADTDHAYTMIDLLKEKGISMDPSDDDVDTYAALIEDDDSVVVNYPQYGGGMNDISKLEIVLDKLYIKDDATSLTDDPSDAKTITSFYKHTEPKPNTLNAQISNAGSPNLPIDKTRKVSFIDKGDEAQELPYLNTFAAENADDVEDQIANLVFALEQVEGGSDFTSELEDFLDGINGEQLQDAFDWRARSIDEKHHYVLTHYLGDEEPIIAKAREGYEITSMIANGSATEMRFAFNGDIPVTEGDLEFNYRSEEAIEAALAAAASTEEEVYEPLAEVSNTTPVVITKWITAIQEWIQEVNDSLTSHDTYEDDEVCGEAFVYDSSANDDADDDGIPDGAQSTASLVLSSDDNEVLLANGGDYYTVAVSAEKSDSSINYEDSFTQVELDVVSGENSVEISGNAVLTLTGGVAIFNLKSADPGNFTIRAVPYNREDLSASNRLSGYVESKFVRVSTYITQNQTAGEGETVEQGSKIEVYDENGVTVAILDPETGDLELRGADAKLREGTAELPTRVAIVDASGESTDESRGSYGVFFLIPEEKTVSIGDGYAGVFVQEIGEGANGALSEAGIALEVDGLEMGLVTALGQIAVSDGYKLEFEDPSVINLYDPIHIVDAEGETAFTVTIKHSFTEGSILSPDPGYENYLSLLKAFPNKNVLGLGESMPEHSWTRPGYFLRKASFFGKVLAESVIEDSDNDLLDDLEEWVIGTHWENADTDNDSYIDGLEIYSGYDPLAEDKKLFMDISADHKAYGDLAVLYLRGVIQGYTDGSFRPDNVITREEFVKIDLGAICKDCDSYSKNHEAELMAEYEQDPFPDTDINPELLTCVAEAKVEGIVSGYAGGSDAGYFVPRQNISRAEATKVLVETAGYEVQAPESDEPWYMGYVRSAQEHNLFPEGSTQSTAWLEAFITRAEFVMMAVNLIEDKDCRVADSDGGGVDDFDELQNGGDPLDASDDAEQMDSNAEDVTGEAEDAESGEDFSDLANYDHEPGLYAVSDQADYEEIVTDSGESTATVTLFTNEIPADGESVLYVRGEIRDQEDNIYVEDDTSVIEFILSTTEYGELTSNRVQVQAGLAETTFVTSQVAGELTVEGRISDGSLPSENALVQVYPGTPVRVDLAGESSVLPAGAESVTDMTANLYDSYGNLAYNGFYTVTFTTEGGVTLLDLNDEDTTLEGTQVTTSEGSLFFRVLASPVVETASVGASLLEVPDSGDRFSIEHKENLSLRLAATQPYLFAGSGSGEEITVSIVDENGARVSGFQGDVDLSLSDPAYGTFESTTLALQSGQVTTFLNPGTLGGTGSMIAESAGIEGGSTPLIVKPAEPYELRIRKEDGSTLLNSGEEADLAVESFDIYGNLVTTDGSSSGTLRLTESTEAFGALSSSSFTLSGGAERFTVTTEEISGVLNIVASSGNLLAGTWSGIINYELTGEDFAEVQPQTLYTSLLGAPFGDVTAENYIGGWMTFNGKTQAMTSLVSEPKPSKRLVSMDASGAISISEDSMVTQTVGSAGSQLPTRIQWRSFPDDVLMGEAFYVMPSGGDSPTAELLTSDDDFTVEDGVDGSLLLREESAAAVKIRGDGQISILDSRYSLVVNAAAEGLGFAVLKNGTEKILRIDFSPWNSDLSVVQSSFDLENWDTLSAGIYLKPTVVSENRIVAIPTGNSSLNPMGLAIVDPEQELAKDMQPSLGYTSLEAADDDGNIGWENENKHLLLFSAGNTVGQSNLFYPSEVGIVLGDPTIQLPTPNETNELGYTTDVGTLVSASQEEIQTLMDLDYNGDDKQDILAAYEDGRIEVLQNADAAMRLKNRGDLLFIENGISSIDKGDFNNDGLDDLLIVTEESCYAEEMCLYIYENIGGGFVAENLTLEGVAGKPIHVEVADLNNDDYDEVVLVNENMVLYVVWNAEGTLETVDTIKDFGLNADSGENLYEDLVVHYDGLDEGSVSLPVLTTDLTDSGATNADLEAFVEALSLDEDFTVKYNGGVSEGVVRKENTSFEYADNEDVMARFDISKTLEDSNGGNIEVNDLLTTTIRVENYSGQTYSDFYLSDEVGTLFSMDKESFQCLACSESNAAVELQNGDSVRPFIFGPLRLEDGELLTVTYSMGVDSLPSLSVMIGQDFYSDYKDDNFADLAVSLEGNGTGELLVFFSDGYITETEGEGLLGIGGTSYRRISYQEQLYGPTTYEAEYDTSVDNPFGDSDEDGIPDFVENMDPEQGIPVPTDGSFDFVAEILGGKDVHGKTEDDPPDGYYSADEMSSNDTDADNDGLNDTVDSWVGGDDVLLDAGLDLSGDSIDLDASVTFLDEEIEGLTQKVEEVVSMFTCNGGCLALPGSVAFLAMGNFHEPMTGATLGFDFGTPIFGILPYLPVVCAGQMCYGSNVMRMYLAPTTTLGIGLGLCLGPYGVGQCFAFNIPLLQALGVCDAINGFIADSLSKATSFVSEGVTAAFNVGETAKVSAGTSGLESTIFTGYEPPISLHKNIQVPGFPSILTEWWKAQKEEFFKMLDLPDITFIYPDPKSLTTEFTGISQKARENATNNVVALDQKNKVEKLTSGTLGLEKWLNMAHALPLIDIKPKKVPIRYPWITAEERELIAKDWYDWVEDAKREWDAFEHQFSLRDNVSDEEREIFGELEQVVNEAITAMETNLAVLESYKEIPEKILLIREMMATYAKSIICYVDAILSHTAGYLTENAQRAEAWGQFIVDLREIVNGWQVLIDLSADLMDSCDKCTNQRYSGMQLLFSLFVFVPDLPVVEMPKLPDIVIDASNIQAGLNIVWPDIDFVPERINIPEIPRLYLPGVNLNAHLDLDLNIPTLPEFNVDVDLPELPGLTLPSLPSLPPPPAVPELDPTLKAGLKIVSNVLKVVCTIRQGFIPIPEFALKSKIEEITERPGGILLPIDTATTVERPKISFDFLKKIKINTYLNLNTDFSVLFDFVKGIGTSTNDMTTDFVQKGLNQSLEDLQRALQDVFNVVGDTEVNVDVGVEAEADLEEGTASGSAEGGAETNAEDVLNEAEEDLEENVDELIENLDDGLNKSSYNEAMNTATAYKNHPLVQQNLIALREIMETTQSELKAWDDEMPETITLTATVEHLAQNDPRLNRYEEVLKGYKNTDVSFLASIQDTPLASLVNVRDSLIASVEDFDQGTVALSGMDDEGFYRYLAQENASLPTVLAGHNAEGYSGIEEWDALSLGEDLGQEVELEQEIALAEESNSAADAALEAVNLGESAQSINSGFFLYNPELGISTRLMDYTQEADEHSNILFVDLDGDDDEDIIYSMGGDVYFKENHTEEADLDFVNSNPERVTVSDWDPGHESVYNFKRGQNDYQEASFSFREAPASTGYEIMFYDSLDAQESEPQENIKRLLLLNDDKNSALPFTDDSGNEYSTGTDLDASLEELRVENAEGAWLSIPKGYAYVLPEIRKSRLVAEDVGGDVKLRNAYGRTLITSNGELETVDAVTLQTTEDTLIKIQQEGETVDIRLPAFQVISLGRSEDRIIRIERGAVYWLDPTQTVEEQDLEEGMEIFVEELVSLESSSADAELVTSEGGIIELDKEETFVMDELLNASSPSASIEIENGAYYTMARALYADGAFGTLSDNVLLNPQVCADDSEPYILVDDEGADSDGDGAVEVAIFSTRELSAEASFDSDSSIVDAYWDLDADVDSDGDGLTSNDEQVIGLTADIGPYEDTDPRTVMLYATDAAGNTASVTIAVEIYVPDITITQATVDRVSGSTDPASPIFPFHLVRDRSGSVTEIGDGYSTDDYGDFSEEMIDSDLISVSDAEGNMIAEFNPETKQLIVYDEEYESAVLSSDADWPSRLVVYEKSTGIIMSSFLFVADGGDPIQKAIEPLENYDLSAFDSLLVYPVRDEGAYTFTDTSVVAHDDYGSLDFMVSQSGNITVFDNRYTLVKRAADFLDEYLVIEVYDGGVLELEIWPGTPDSVEIVTADEFNLPPSELVEDHESLSADTRLYFEDISTEDPLYEDIAELVERGVLEGYEENGLRYFKPDQAISRAEFTKIVLSILCIVPRDEAEVLPAVFTDILSDSLWYFPHTKEAFLRDLITGYLGEVNSQGVSPFKPEKTISRAEAVKIVLEALDKEGIITLPEDLFGEPWFDPYMEIAQNLTLYMSGDRTAGEANYIITPEEAADPYHEMTRYEFVEMSVRVLQAYNCFDLDSDGDGLINYDEEALYGTDPYNPDTDSGGVDDGTEVGRSSDPLNGEDDFDDGSLEGISGGTYAVSEVCSACPCSSTVDYDADLKPGDSVFAIIQNDEGEIFGISNTVTVQESTTP